MKKVMNKKIVMMLFILIYIMSINSIVWANDEFVKENDENLTQRIAIKYKLSDEEQKGLAVFDEDQQKEIEEFLKTNRQAVEIDYRLSEIDEIGEIRKVAQATLTELQDGGMSLKEAINTKKEIDMIKSKTKEELVNEYNISKTDAKVLKNASLDSPNKVEDGYKNIDMENKCSASGTISTKKMASSMVKYDNSKKVNGKRKNADYEILVHYQWQSDPMFVASSDKIACAWGGGLNVTTKKTQATYRYHNPAKNRYIFTNKTPSSDEKPNKGIIYTFPQKYSKGTIYSAYARLRLYQGTFKNYSTKAVSNYAHRIIKATGGTISISTTPGINIGAGFDKSKQVNQKLLR